MGKLKNVVVAVLISAAVFFTYTALVSDWRYWMDDCGLAYEGRNIKSWRDCGRYFLPKFSILKLVQSTNFEDEAKNFCTTVYRPIAPVWLGVEGWRLTAYQSFLISIGIWSLAIAFIFYIFAMLVPVWLAVLAALFVAFHSSLNEWIWFLCNQPHLLSVVVLALVCLSLKKVVESGVYWYAAIGWLAFIVHLLTLENLLVLPFWLVFAIPVFLIRRGTADWISQTIKLVAPFFMVVFAYCAFKLLYYPMMGVGGKIPMLVPGFLEAILEKIRTHEMTTMVVNFLGINWLGEGTAVAKSSFIIVSIVTWIFLFMRSKYRVEMVVLMIGALMFLWPALIMMFVPRYLLISVIFWVMSLLVGVIGFSSGQAVLATMLSFGIVFGSSHNLYSVLAFEIKVLRFDYALTELVTQLKGRYSGQTVVFVGTPEEWFHGGGTAQALRSKMNDPLVPVCVDWRTSTRSFISWSRPETVDLPRADSMKILFDGHDTFHMISGDKKNLWFYYGGGDVVSTLGERRVVEYAATPWGKRAYDLVFKLDHRWMKNGMIPVTWDFVNGRLKILE